MNLLILLADDFAWFSPRLGVNININFCSGDVFTYIVFMFKTAPQSHPLPPKLPLVDFNIKDIGWPDLTNQVRHVIQNDKC